MDYKIEERKEKLYTIGNRVLEERGSALVGISTGNSYFSQDIIDALIRWTVNSFSNVKIFIPYQIAEHTYRALGYKKPRKKAREDGRRLQRYCQNVIDMIFPANIEILDWETDIEAHPAYLKGYKEIHLLYQTNENFWYDVRETTREVLNGKLKPDADIEDAIDEGINYLLKEISFFIMSHKIFQIKRMGFVYHNGWHILEKLVNGDYDEKQRENFGMIIVKFY